jgi:hybrid cluster-associated redox disulfide protein
MIITKEMSIEDCVSKYPETVRIFELFGMGCIGCAASTFESIEEGASAHEMNIEALMKALNASITAA